VAASGEGAAGGRLDSVFAGLTSAPDRCRSTRGPPLTIDDLVGRILGSIGRDMSAAPAGAGPDATGAITRDEVAHLARLARLAVSEEELDVFAGQLDVILGAVARVGEVAADEIPPTSHAVPLSNVFRADERRPGLTQEQALGCAPAAEDGRFRVPRILGEEQ
jgi:aspartyl-tRNA(Asn)/glutamyl-tRNA(Gln) amidotransferase subunit C